ncbi:lycopene cyclase family protein [Virgisporangium ochraceum]|uniref:Lycopene cyclase n=1 Tax=Virgisporangium ochraceum TaxID=65505 RepID=A0A8J4A0F8_9ACTN|nr:lycopene cyclase family protein [Virgisporangium ochraceum]GIJ71663.1 lycopene cyclase [Virgisporangium ochraceum]
MSADRFDAVIAGGGASGLSLAAHLAVAGWRNRSVLVVDDPVARPAAQCWGFWAAAPALLDAAVSHRYRRLGVHAAGADAVVALRTFEYQVVHRRDLRHVVAGLLRRCPAFTLAPGRVGDVRDGEREAEITVDGVAVRAGWVFDSVSASPPTGAADARLAFTGWEIECARPVFDPDVPTLFDFRVPQGDAARFVYVLPHSDRRALVEVTEFVPRHGRPTPPDGRAALLAGYISGVLDGSGYTVGRTESAVLPLRASPPPRSGRHVLRIGACGGIVKASTGYAYQRIHRDSAAIARSLARGGHPFDRPRPSRWYRFLDSVLLDVLDRDPHQIERTFARLFLGNPADRVLRFLDECSPPGEQLRLIATMPKAPYVRSVARRALRRW